MTTYVYINKNNNHFSRISDHQITDLNLVQVATLPKNTKQKWQNDQWVDLTNEEVLASQIDIEQALKHSVVLNDLSQLNISNDQNKIKDLDILYYRTVAPKQQEEGIYINRRGYLAFPQLAWNKDDEIRTTSFIWYASSYQVYIAFGLMSEFYNLSSNNYKQAEIVLRLKNFRGAYHQYGRSEKGQNLFGYQGYFTFEHSNFYRLDIENNGAKGEFATIYKLQDSNPKNWLAGKYVDSIRLANPPCRKGEKLMPFMGEYNSSKNRLIGVVTR